MGNISIKNWLEDNKSAGLITPHGPKNGPKKGPKNGPVHIAPRWRPDFEQRSRCHTKICHTQC